ncbi:MAG TPA: molybdopterin cofactor-binding domain-containing protein, partial [Solirubrobacteraceae bacterium]
ELRDGSVRATGAPQVAVPIAELAGSGAAILGKGSGPVPQAPACTPDAGCLGRLGFESFLEPQLITHAVHVRVDRETGVVRILRVAAAHDSGTILNPVGANGQVLGGVVMGIGQALSEGMQLDGAGRQLNPHLLDYKLVTSADAPPIEIAWVQTPAVDGGPNGSKGIGEPPCVPTPGAIANAIARATGKRVHRLPMTPERVWETIR